MAENLGIVRHPPAAGIPERDPAAGHPSRVLLGEELRQQLLGFPLGGRGTGQVDAIAGHRIGADVDADLVDTVPLADAAAPSLCLVRGHTVDGSAWTEIEDPVDLEHLDDLERTVLAG
jgi:hypothetical protein